MTPTSPDPALIMAGVLVTLAFFGLVAYLATVFRDQPARAALVLGSVTTLVAVLPAILIALYH